MPLDLVPINSSSVPISSSTNKLDLVPVQSSAPSQESTGDKIAKVGYAAAQGTLSGMTDAAEAMGGLAKNILKGGAHLLYGSLLSDPAAEKNVKEGLDLMGQYGSKLTDAARSYIAPKSDLEKQALQEHPVINKAMDLTGYVGGLLGSGNAITAPLGAIASPLVKALPVIGKSPAVVEGVSQAAQNAVAGAAANENNPVGGAIIGGIAGGALGTVAGSLGYKIDRASKIINHEADNAVLTGNEAGAHATVASIQQQLRNEGIHLRELEIKQNIKNAVDSKLAAIRPEGYDPINDRPINYIAKAAQTNLVKELQTSKDLYAPLNESKEVFSTPSFSQTLESAKLNPKIDLPETTETIKSGQNTLENMLTYRKQLDKTIAKAKILSQTNPEVPQSAMAPLYNIRGALNNDIHEAAKSAGLEDQLNSAEQHWNTKLQPFTVFGKNLSALKAMDEGTFQNNVWKTLNRQLQARFPNPNLIKDAAQTLGPEGKSMVGWAKIENDFDNSFKNGLFQSSTFMSRIAKGENNGLNKIVMSDEHRDVIQGLNKVMIAANQYKAVTPKEGFINEHFVQPVIKQLMYNRAGIELLKVIGSSSTPIKAARTLISNVLIGTVAISQAKNAGNTQPQQ